MLVARTRFSGKVKGAKTISFFSCELRVVSALGHLVSDITIYVLGKGSVVMSPQVLYLYFVERFLPFHGD